MLLTHILTVWSNEPEQLSLSQHRNVQTKNTNTTAVSQSVISVPKSFHTRADSLTIDTQIGSSEQVDILHESAVCLLTQLLWLWLPTTTRTRNSSSAAPCNELLNPPRNENPDLCIPFSASQCNQLQARWTLQMQNNWCFMGTTWELTFRIYIVVYNVLYTFPESYDQGLWICFLVKLDLLHFRPKPVVQLDVVFWYV